MNFLFKLNKRLTFIGESQRKCSPPRKYRIKANSELSGRTYTVPYKHRGRSPDTLWEWPICKWSSIKCPIMSAVNLFYFSLSAHSIQTRSSRSPAKYILTFLLPAPRLILFHIKNRDHFVSPKEHWAPSLLVEHLLICQNCIRSSNRYRAHNIKWYY